MTLFGWDSSHYDGVITPSIAARAADEGIAFATHKLGEGLTNTDPAAGQSLSAFRGAGLRVLGGYYFLTAGLDPVAQARRCVTVADAVCGWWRSFPGWFWQTDAERGTGGLPTPSEIRRFSDTLAGETERTVVVYASAGQYGDRLANLGHYLWNAHYGGNPTGSFQALYPGDDSAGWKAYSGQTPALLQYGSGATIAGRTTCDANAFRGTLDQLLTLIGAGPDPSTGGTTDMPLTDADATLVARKVWNLILGSTGPTAGATLETAATRDAVAALQADLDEVKAQAAANGSALTGLGSKVDELLAAVNADAGDEGAIAGDLTVTGTLHVVEATPVPPVA